MLREMLIALMAEFIGFGKHPTLQGGDRFGRLVRGREEVSVSYTHLTLPTIYSV